MTPVCRCSAAVLPEAKKRLHPFLPLAARLPRFCHVSAAFCRLPVFCRFSVYETGAYIYVVRDNIAPPPLSAGRCGRYPCAAQADAEAAEDAEAALDGGRGAGRRARCWTGQEAQDDGREEIPNAAAWPAEVGRRASGQGGRARARCGAAAQPVPVGAGRGRRSRPARGEGERDAAEATNTAGRQAGRPAGRPAGRQTGGQIAGGDAASATTARSQLRRGRTGPRRAGGDGSGRGSQGRALSTRRATRPRSARPAGRDLGAKTAVRLLPGRSVPLP